MAGNSGKCLAGSGLPAVAIFGAALISTVYSRAALDNLYKKVNGTLDGLDEKMAVVFFSRANTRREPTQP